MQNNLEKRWSRRTNTQNQDISATSNIKIKMTTPGFKVLTNRLANGHSTLRTNHQSLILIDQE
ncbi:hypothetical protein BD408DRAFT_214353 [Parasitella parasitica]|nr:hypothetical protein BD408DRAFT_214353 [Parasitella parasitica]